MTRRYYSSTAQDNTISASMDATQGTMTVTSLLSGWPSQYPFHARLDAGTASEELVLITAAPSGLVYPVTRAQSGTTGHSHSASATLKHCATSTDFDEANAHGNATTNVHGLSGGDSVAGTIALGLKADDSAVVHLTGNETIAGIKTFSSAPAVPDSSFAQAKVTGLTSSLSTVTTAAAAAQTTANTAVTNAATAQTTANTANSAASAAQTTANTANTTANSAVAALSWSTLTLQSGFTAYGAGYGTPQYAKDARGVVYLRGVITNSGSTGNGTSIATLPSGSRPSAIRRFAAYLSGTGTIQGLDITTAGSINVLTSATLGAGSQFSLDGIIFDTAS